MAEESPEPDERPRWSFTWLMRVQRVGRSRPIQPLAGDEETPKPSTFMKLVPWIIMGALGVEVAIGVWLDLLPR